MTRKQFFREGDEERDPHGYIQTMNPPCILGHKLNAEQLSCWYRYCKDKNLQMK